MKAHHLLLLLPFLITSLNGMEEKWHPTQSNHRYSENEEEERIPEWQLDYHNWNKKLETQKFSSNYKRIIKYWKNHERWKDKTKPYHLVLLESNFTPDLKTLAKQIALEISASTISYTTEKKPEEIHYETKLPGIIAKAAQNKADKERKDKVIIALDDDHQSVNALEILSEFVPKKSFFGGSHPAPHPIVVKNKKNTTKAEKSAAQIVVKTQYPSTLNELIESAWFILQEKIENESKPSFNSTHLSAIKGQIPELYKNSTWEKICEVTNERLQNTLLEMDY